MKVFKKLVLSSVMLTSLFVGHVSNVKAVTIFMGVAPEIHLIMALAGLEQFVEFDDCQNDKIKLEAGGCRSKMQNALKFGILLLDKKSNAFYLNEITNEIAINKGITDDEKDSFKKELDRLNLAMQEAKLSQESLDDLRGEFAPPTINAIKKLFN